MMKVSSVSGDISVACSIIISDNKDSLGMVKDKSKYGLMTLTKNGLLQLQFVSKLVLSYNVTDLSSIFDRFVDEGKATLRFKKAAQDIMLQSKDANGLKLFVKAVKSLRTMASANGGKPGVIGQLPLPKSKTLNVVVNNKENCPTALPGVPVSKAKNENGKRPVLSNAQPEEQPAVLPKRRQTISGPAVLKKSESVHGKVLRRLNEGSNYVSSLSCEKCRILSFSRSDELANLSSLELIECGLSSFPRELAFIPNLTTLNLANNNIARIDTEIFSSTLKLTSLDLSFNRLCSLPLSVSNLKSVRSLLLRGNRIRVITALPPSVVRVDVSQNPLNTIWVSKLTKFFGDVDISGLIAPPPDEEAGTSLAALRKVTGEPISFNREIPSLFEFSARSTTKNWLSVFWRHIPEVIISQLESECLCCLCSQLVLLPALVRRCALVHVGWRSQMTDSTSLTLNFLSVTCQICASLRRNSNLPNHLQPAGHRPSLA